MTNMTWAVFIWPGSCVTKLFSFRYKGRRFVILLLALWNWISDHLRPYTAAKRGLTPPFLLLLNHKQSNTLNVFKSQLFKFQLLNGTNLIPQNHTNISRFEISLSADVRSADRNVTGESDSALNSNSDLEKVIHALFYLLHPSFPFWQYYICLSDLFDLHVSNKYYVQRSPGRDG